jgi:hypothetical protein
MLQRVMALKKSVTKRRARSPRGAEAHASFEQMNRLKVRRPSWAAQGQARRQSPVNDKDQIESRRQQHFPNFPLALR